jgi:hypothetical protein
MNSFDLEMHASVPDGIRTIKLVLLRNAWQCFPYCDAFHMVFAVIVDRE